MRDGKSALDIDPKSAVGGGVEDVYGEDRATEDQLVTPWTLSVARSHFHHPFISLFLRLLFFFFFAFLIYNNKNKDHINFVFHFHY